MKKIIFIPLLVALVTGLLLAGCLGTPDNIKPVTNFQAEKFLGTWYEIARLDYIHEKGLNQVTATYSLRTADELKVVNRGYESKKSRWKESEGKAFFVDGKDKGYLKVSFFWPFYSSYVVFDIDDNYQYALVTSSEKSNLWILARTPTISGEIKANLIAKATAQGFDTSKLVFVEQTEIAKSQ
ncbi:MAG: lipocalin [Gammaproteobacteria bacterium]|nr:MAG: lipocalin [Gammaproteobacteria bacterium]